MVNDTPFNSEKARSIHEFLSSQKNMVGFTFVNSSVDVDTNDTEFSDF